MFRQENSCGGKNAYLTAELCNESVKHLNKLGGKRVKTYRCKTCSLFHYGHESKGKNMSPSNKKVKKKITDFDHEPSVHIVDKRFLK